jgi:phosphoribosyl 1,2-cyclic phosphodiesterase
VRIRLLGVRGSVPTPGRDFVRYGGNTSCVAVSAGDRPGPPSLVLDAGTGMRMLPDLLDGAPFDGTVLLSHLHWDHVEGLPFCSAVDRDDARTALYIPGQENGADALAVLGRMMSPPNFPITPDQLRGRWSFSSLAEGTHPVEEFTVKAASVAHKGGVTYGYRVSDGDSTLAYLPDHCPTLYGPGPDGLGAIPAPVVELVEGADVLIHDAQLTSDELPAGAAFGHAALEYAVALGVATGVSTVVLFHHSPRRTDDMLDVLADQHGCHQRVRVLIAREGCQLVC